MCPLCGIKDGIIFHALVSCLEKQQVWFASPLGLKMDTTRHNEFKAWLTDCTTQVKEDVKSITITLCWAIWFGRNQLVFQKKKWL